MEKRKLRIDINSSSSRQRIEIFFKRFEMPSEYITHFFRSNINSFTYYFFAQAIILLTRETPFRPYGIILSLIFFFGGFSLSSFPARKGIKPEELSWGYLLSGIFIPLIFGISMVLLVIK